MDLHNPKEGIFERIVVEDLPTVSGAEHLAGYLFAAHWAAGRDVVDLCCGVGYGTNLLLAAGANSARGIDVSKDAIEEARRRFAAPDFTVGDVTQSLGLGADLYVCLEGLEHLSNPKGLLENMAGGTAIISTPNAEHSEVPNPHHVREYTLEELRDLLEQYFATVQIYFQWRYPNPFDVTWTPGQIARALVPVPIKHRLKRRRAPETSAGACPVSASHFQPMPLGYRRVLPPGMRFGKPNIWTAVCS